MSTIETLQAEARRKAVTTDREVVRAVEIATGLFFLNGVHIGPTPPDMMCSLRFDTLVQAIAAAAAEARYIAEAEVTGV